jgi:hypothetical protein
MRRIFARVLFLSALLLLVQGCGTIVPGTPWELANYRGPELLETNGAYVVSRCAAISTFMSKGPCELAFIDHLGNKVLWVEVQRAIDEYMPKVVSLVKSEKSSEASLSKYEFHILTISPVVVLALPRREYLPFEDSYCGGQIYVNGCIPSKQTSGYWYLHTTVRRGPPEHGRVMAVGAGSFWFSPELDSGVHFLPDDSLNYTIELLESRIQLTAKPTYVLQLIPKPHVEISPEGNLWNTRRSLHESICKKIISEFNGCKKNGDCSECLAYIRRKSL